VSEWVVVEKCRKSYMPVVVYIENTANWVTTARVRTLRVDGFWAASFFPPKFFGALLCRDSAADHHQPTHPRTQQHSTAPSRPRKMKIIAYFLVEYH
jgi:hypothetical protein